MNTWLQSAASARVTRRCAGFGVDGLRSLVDATPPVARPTPSTTIPFVGLATLGVAATVLPPYSVGSVHLVTVLEDMPVQETADGIAELTKDGLPVGGVVVNLVRSQDGSEPSTDAVHSTLVSPKPTRQLPSAWRVKAGSKRTSRIWSGARPLGRMQFS